jgi:beta-1,4-N-acetylglucosaminyltransferase
MEARVRRLRNENRTELLLVCSPGGHLLQLVQLRSAWQGEERAWVTLDKSDARSLLDGERVFYAYGPTNRSLKNLARNLPLALRLVWRLRPKVILTSGAGVAVPFAWAGRLLGARVVFVESLTRIDSVSLSCRMIAPVAARIYVQWPDAGQRLREARYVGSLFSDA